MIYFTYILDAENQTSYCLQSRFHVSGSVDLGANSPDQNAW